MMGGSPTTNAKNPQGESSPAKTAGGDNESMAGEPGESAQPVREPVSPHATFQLRAKHSCLIDVWNEWFGYGEFADDHGGVAGRNAKFGKKWKREAPCLDHSQFSRTQRVIAAISSQSVVRNVQPEDVIEEWEILYERCNKSLGLFVRGLQQLHYIPKQKTRGRHASKNKNNNNQ